MLLEARRLPPGATRQESSVNSAFSKIGLPPEALSQFVPVRADYLGKVGG